MLAAAALFRGALVHCWLPACALGLCLLVTSRTRLVAAEIGRLPPVRLPLVSSNSMAGAGAAVDTDDVVRLAGGAVELRVPQGWWIWEVPRGREVRVAFSPTRPSSLKAEPASGYWVCFHLLQTSSADPRTLLAEQMQRRLVEVTAGEAAPLQAVQFQRLGAWDAAELEFTLPVAGRADARPVQGSHVLVLTPWGLFEFHARFPADRYQEQLGEMARLLRHVTLAAPPLWDAGSTTAETNAAASIHGSWKAFRSRLRLRGSGGIEIVTDRAQLISPPDAEAATAGPELLQGQYRAEGDLLFVQWRDGSKSNFRWKLNGGDLLLTDHEGRISQLRRLAE